MWNSLFGWLSLIITTGRLFRVLWLGANDPGAQIPTGPIRIASNERRRARGERKQKSCTGCSCVCCRPLKCPFSWWWFACSRPLSKLPLRTTGAAAAGARRRRRSTSNNSRLIALQEAKSINIRVGGWLTIRFLEPEQHAAAAVACCVCSLPLYSGRGSSARDRIVLVFLEWK
jgi:hypothetical protein